MKILVFIIGALLLIFACKNSPEITSEAITKSGAESVAKYPSNVIPFMNKWKILLGDGSHTKTLENYEKKDFFMCQQKMM